MFDESPVPEVYEFYNVMWIERDADGIAYRKAMGVVRKEAWDKGNPETVEIILG